MEPNVGRDTKPLKIVVGIDFSPMSRRVLDRALDIANLTEGAEVHLVTVADYDRTVLAVRGPASAQTPPDATAKLHELASSGLQDLSARGPVRLQRVVTHLLTGSPASEIVWLAAHLDADLIVVGTHGRTGASRFFLGSVAERVVRVGGCPVYVVREKHHDSAWKVPEIEPPCPDCLASRERTGGEQLWCERHQSHVRTHVYSSADPTYAAARPWGFASS
jgi:nucleotide-binding universal stress UspA family protein